MTYFQGFLFFGLHIEPHEAMFYIYKYFLERRCCQYIGLLHQVNKDYLICSDFPGCIEWVFVPHFNRSI